MNTRKYDSKTRKALKRDIERYQVASRGKHLPEFDENRPQRLQRTT